MCNALLPACSARRRGRRREGLSYLDFICSTLADGEVRASRGQPMSFEDSIRQLLALGELDPRKAARVAWVKETVDKWREAMRQMDERCIEAVDHLSEEAFERLFEAEQAKVDAIRAPLD